MGLLRRKPAAPRPRRRRGLVHKTVTFKTVGTSHDVQYEVVEVERVEGLSRVQIVRVSGTPAVSDAKNLLPAWLKSSDVVWFPEDGA